MLKNAAGWPKSKKLKLSESARKKTQHKILSVKYLERREIL